MRCVCEQPVYPSGSVGKPDADAVRAGDSEVAVSASGRCSIAVNCFRHVRRDKPVSHVGCDLFRIALARVAETATAWQLEAQTLARRNGLLSLAAQQPTRCEGYASRSA